MSRLLALSGEVVGIGDTAFTLTAYDPASGLYIGLAHAPGNGKNFVGCTPEALFATEAATTDQLSYVIRKPQPLLGPILQQNSYGVCGQMRRQLQLGVVETARAVKGPACIITNARPRRELIAQGWLSVPHRILEAMQTGLFKTSAIPIEITDLSGGGLGFYYAGKPALHGLSGSPIIQNGHLVGAVYGHLTNDPTTGIGRNIEPMMNSLLGTEVRRVAIGGKQKGFGRSGKHASRKGQAERHFRSFRNRQGYTWLGRAQNAQVLYQSLVNQAPEMARLEAQIRRYEAGRISQGIFYHNQKRSYHEALQLLWNYQTVKMQMVIRSWLMAGAITKEQYHAILRGGEPPEV